MKQFTLLCAACLLLAACTSPAQQAEYQRQLEIADNNECIRLGFKPNTAEYGDCRLRLREMRQRERAMRTPYPYYGVGYGHSHWRGGHFLGSGVGF